MKRGRVVLVLVVGATVLFYVGLFVVRPLLASIVFRMPENYENLARHHFDNGEYEKAIEACQREIGPSRYPYNFGARFLLAEILHRSGRSAEALEQLWKMPSLYLAVRGREDVPSRGWDEARVHITLAEVLWDLGRHEESLDELQVALDWRDPKVEDKCTEFVARIRLTSDARLAPWAHVAEVIMDENEEKKRPGRVPESRLFKLAKPPPNFYTRLSQIALGRENVETARGLNDKELIFHPRDLPSLRSYRLFTEQFPPPPSWRGVPEPRDFDARIRQLWLGRVTYAHKKSLPYSAHAAWVRFWYSTSVKGVARPWLATKGACIIARAESCNGIWPIVSLRVNGRIVGRRYIRSKHWQAYTVPLVLEPGNRTIEVGFENDAKNKYTGLDRNVEIKEIVLF